MKNRIFSFTFTFSFIFYLASSVANAQSLSSVMAILDRIEERVNKLEAIQKKDIRRLQSQLRQVKSPQAATSLDSMNTLFQSRMNQFSKELEILKNRTNQSTESIDTVNGLVADLHDLIGKIREIFNTSNAPGQDIYKSTFQNLKSKRPSNLKQIVKIHNSNSWTLSGLIQVQNLYNFKIDRNAAKTNFGLQIRRGSFQIKGKVSNWVDAKFHIAIRDNNPRLKDAEGKLKFSKNIFMRFGQFKVPVWRETLRLPGALLLIERSKVAKFLSDIKLSARQVGVEFDAQTQSGLQLAINLSNGAGEGGWEEAGHRKDGSFINNGKLITGRINFALNNILQVALSVGANRVGSKIDTTDNSGTIKVFAPDFGIYLTKGEKSYLDIEGGFAAGSISSKFLGTAHNQNFVLFNLTSRWMTKLQKPHKNLAGMDAVEFAFGISYLEPNRDIAQDENLIFRFGPALYFGKRTRFQINGELEKDHATGADTIFKLRSQASFLF